jgi:hypothetical protein
LPAKLANDTAAQFGDDVLHAMGALSHVRDSDLVSAHWRGIFAALMRGGDVPLQLIEFIQTFANEDGNRIDPATLGLPPDILQTCAMSGPSKRGRSQDGT